MLPIKNSEKQYITGPGDDIAIVEKISNGVYCLHIQGHDRYRWGNTAEIREDINHFTTTGALPKASKGWQ